MTEYTLLLTANYQDCNHDFFEIQDQIHLAF